MKHVIRKPIAEGAYDFKPTGSHSAPGGGQTKTFKRVGADSSVILNAQTKLPDGRRASSATMEHYKGHSVHHMVGDDDVGNTHQQDEPHTAESLLKAHHEMVKKHMTSTDKPGYVAAGRVGEALAAYNEAKEIAWSGGSPPKPLKNVSPEERAAARKLYAGQTGEWQKAWGDKPPKDVKRTFVSRARHDAHATHRDSQS